MPRPSDEAVFLTSRQQHDVLVSGGDADWKAFPTPSRTAEITSVAIDPFDLTRFYLGTLREGLYVYEGGVQKYEAKKKPAETVAGTGGSSN